LLWESKKIRSDARKSTNPKPKKDKKNTPNSSSSPCKGEIELEQQGQIEIQEEEQQKEFNQTEKVCTQANSNQGYMIPTDDSTSGSNVRNDQTSEEGIPFPIFNQQCGNQIHNALAQIGDNIKYIIDITVLAEEGAFSLDDLPVLAKDRESVQNYVMLQNLNRFYFGDNNDDDAKNSSQYKSGIQLFTMAISNIFKIKKNSKFNDFKVRFYIECQNQQFSPTAFENYLIIKRLKMLLQLEWQRLGLNKENIQGNLAHVTQYYLQYGIDRQIIQGYLEFKGSKRLIKERCKENGFKEELFNNYLAYELFIKSFRAKCQELNIQPELIEEYLLDQIIGAKGQAIEEGENQQPKKNIRLKSKPRLISENSFTQNFLMDLY